MRPKKLAGSRSQKVVRESPGGMRDLRALPNEEVQEEPKSGQQREKNQILTDVVGEGNGIDHERLCIRPRFALSPAQL